MNKGANYCNEVILLNARFNRLNNRYKKGLISNTDKKVVEANITMDILDLLNEIDINDTKQEPLESKKLIAKGKIEEVFVLLEKNVESSRKLEEITKIRFLYSQLKQRGKRGLLSKEDERIEFVKLNYSLLFFIDSSKKE